MHRPQSTMSHDESQLANKSSRQLQSMGSHGDPMEKLRLKCLSRGATGIMNLGRMFRRLDEDGTKNLNLEAFTKGLKDSGMDISDAEAEVVFELFDAKNEGIINIDEFLIHMRPHMSESRVKVIEECFNKLDKDEDGQLTMADLRKVYNVKDNSRYISGEDDEETILKKFLDNFEDEKTTDGFISKEEFLNYYAGMSASIENDCSFDLMLRHSYKL